MPLKGIQIPVWVLETGLVIAWSSGFIGAKLASFTTSIFVVLFWRFVVVAFILAPFLIRSMVRGLTAKIIGLHAALGAFSMFGYLAMGVRAIDLGVPLGTASLISAIQPLATAALVGLMRLEMITKRQWIGLLLGLFGVCLAIGGDAGSASTLAYGLSIGSAVCLIIATVIAKCFPDDTSLFTALAIQSLVSAILFLPLAASHGSIVPPPDYNFLISVGWFILFSTIAAYGLYWACLRYRSVTRVASLIYLTPPTTILWAWLMFGEPISMGVISGISCCLLGIVLTRKAHEGGAVTTHDGRLYCTGNSGCSALLGSRRLLSLLGRARGSTR